MFDHVCWSYSHDFLTVFEASIHMLSASFQPLGFVTAFFAIKNRLGNRSIRIFSPNQSKALLSYEVFLVQWFQFFWPQLLCKESTMALPNCWKWHPQGGKNQGKVPRLAHCDTAIPKRFPKVFFWFSNGWTERICKFNSVKAYPLVIKHSYWKWPFIVSFPIKNGDFP